MEQVIQIDRLKELTKPMADQLPKSAQGLERHRRIGRIIDNQTEETRLELTEILRDYLLEMKSNEASDIDLGGPGCNGRVWYRVHGDKSPAKMNGHVMSLVETDFLLHNILMPDQRQHLLDNKNLDFSHSIELNNGTSQRFRADMYFDLEHLALNMRKIENEIRPFRELNLHPEIAKALSLKYYKYGLTLVTGITGSGKSSTLDTIIDANNRSVDSHIVIIASPVELIHEPKRSVIRHREVGRDVSSFKAGAVQALRQDPDIIVSW
ncbi:MAG: ATPase, T2SS/T4P/T4SS family [Balneolaceae bacterium]|nr:ATPase, T2SS/T4P/T4SS family [Balneolaceae bacterium]